MTLCRSATHQHLSCRSKQILIARSLRANGEDVHLTESEDRWKVDTLQGLVWLEGDVSIEEETVLLHDALTIVVVGQREGLRVAE